jgi:hypothetical protein
LAMGYSPIHTHFVEELACAPHVLQCAEMSAF